MTNDGGILAVVLLFLVAVVVLAGLHRLLRRRAGAPRRLDSTADWGELLDRVDVLVLHVESAGNEHWYEAGDIAVMDTTGTVLFQGEVHVELVETLADATLVCAYNAYRARQRLRKTAKRQRLRLPAVTWRCLMQDFTHGGQWVALRDAADRAGVDVIPGTTRAALAALVDAKLALTLMRTVAKR